MLEKLDDISPFTSLVFFILLMISILMFLTFFRMNGIENEWKSKTVLIPSIGENGFVEEATFLKGGEVVLFIKLENGKTIKMFASEVKKTEEAE